MIHPMQLRDHTRVPFLDLPAQHRPLVDDIVAAVRATLETGAFANGPAVAAFEEAFAGFVGTRRAVGVASGLDALRLALIACDVGPGDEVVIPANTFIATAEAVSQVGATPVLVDASSADWNIDPSRIEAAITSRTRALLPVHLYGQLADMTRMLAIGAEHELPVIEDACQAHGATRDGFRAGAAGSASAFSFYPGKNLGAIGDAGALTTDDDVLAARVRRLREHGQSAKYVHDEVGYTARLDTIQAAALLIKLPYLAGWNDERRRIAAQYLDGLAGVGDLELPPVAPRSDPAWHLVVILTADPDGLIGHLSARGIGTGRHYPIPLHRTGAYAHLGLADGAFPVAERIASRCVSLPNFPGMREEQVARVIATVRDWFDG
jgi:dTDP-3-amino-3,4,6-trideoxy-alpha-D-glucose transaminase